MISAVEFPETQPPGYHWFDDEPTFDPARHLALTMPDQTWDLGDLGYGADEIATKATGFAVSAPFRILSDEGAAIMLDVGRRLRAFHRPAADRIERMTRGGCYRSRWLRDLCTSPTLCAHMSEIYGVEVAPHPMPLHLGHLNYDPSDLTRSVDRWHHDTLPLDFVLFASDPRILVGGQFEWFHGTRHEAAALAEQGRTPPTDRVVAPLLPGPGWAVALHGDMVVHRGATLHEHAERITMVNGYVATDTSRDEQSRSKDLIQVDDPAVLYAEWARFAAWRSSSRLNAIIESIEFGSTPAETADLLDAAVADVQRAAAEMRAGAPSRVSHYE